MHDLWVIFYAILGWEIGRYIYREIKFSRFDCPHCAFKMRWTRGQPIIEDFIEQHKANHKIKENN